MNDDAIKSIEEFLNAENSLDDEQNLKNNIKKLLREYKRMSHRIDTIIGLSDKQQLQMMKLNEELDEHKHNLEIKVEEEIQKRQEKEKMLLQQSRLAAMGEMMDAVAHQWNQPIGIISLRVQMMKSDYEDNAVNKEYIQEFQTKVLSQIEHMMNTLHEFRSFLRPSKNTTDFDVKTMIDKVLLLVKDELIKNNIVVDIDNSQNFTLHGIENEFKHLMINLINNAKDAFVEKNIKNRKITINILNDDVSKRIEVVDNAGGIPENILPNIFAANFTTKEEGKGTGIGLYMSSLIAQKHNGTLGVANTDNGAKFIFEAKVI